MFYLNKLIRDNQKTYIKRNEYLRLDKNERNFKLDNKYSKKITKAVSDTLIQSYPENIEELKKSLLKKRKLTVSSFQLHPGQTER